ncbi:gliding motility-associated C-terminal domain-containing protein [Cellulophaga sp. HaHa_2_1]|uniref:gliding motility-associated C-terminal domain-containing protein n=1 Tax=Cellulophaga sp. HaHa_2_1 TaxID=2749994 RepID=UPI001C4F7A1A|nr:gliding motility-associated C-terminal domain-containing protein [Cellulophaga sp. HaHa_2_1]QXP51777.1 gliding motility-associated C-terminal domain-containing protein [Cellulophaga sp. HaHa_2_1]
MKYLHYILFLCVALATHAQTALNHTGGMQVHDGAEVGFHINFMNNSPFDQNLGLVGFYGPRFLTIRGTTSPTFYDFEIFANNGVTLEVATNATNNVNFVSGNIITQKSLEDIYFGLLDNAMHNGESNMSKINGYALITNQQTYQFPIGDEFQLRPLILNSNSVNLTAKCAYFFENPNAPLSFTQTFDTGDKDRQLSLINTQEFWRLESSVPSTVTISWNSRSAINTLTEVIENLLVVGWNKAEEKWDILGNTVVSGDSENGIITSEEFLPDDYEIITIGSLLVPQDRLTIDNFYLSPNGDGINDVLVIEELELSSQNELKLYDRNGLLVFRQENYTNEFAGISNIDNNVIQRDAGLPSGIYFYIVNMYDLGYEFQGFLYLAQPTY